MTETVASDGTAQVVAQAVALADRGGVREAIDLLTEANRSNAHAVYEQELLRLRREGASGVQRTPGAGAPPMPAATAGTGVFEVAASELTPSSYLTGLARSGCTLVRGLVPPERVARLRAGIDAALAASDAAADGAPVTDPGWFSPGSMPDRVSHGLSEDDNRRFLRDRGGLWTADSPRMLFEVFELVDDVGVGDLMTAVLGERPLLSALKCTLRRVPADLVVTGGWHQDGAFLGEQVGAFNLWISLSHCGRDAPGLDLVPKRVDRVVPSDEESRFDWSLSDRAVAEVAGDVTIARPIFEPGDALLFDHLLVHRTATSPDMTRDRYAIESWFFAPSAYPAGQLPLLY